MTQEGKRMRIEVEAQLEKVREEAEVKGRHSLVGIPGFASLAALGG